MYWRKIVLSIILGSGAIIVAPCHKEAKWGYVFRDCTIGGNEARLMLRSGG